MVSPSNTLNVLSDEKALLLFETIATTSNKKNYTAMLITNLNLTRKQYYFRMRMVMDAGLVKRESGNYYLTTFGKVTYYFHRIIQSGINNYWRLKAIDMFEDIPKEERIRLIDSLLDNNNDRKLKEMLCNMPD
jgi:hypothetical protein